MADEKRSAPTSSRTLSIDAGAPQVSSTMLANAPSPPPMQSRHRHRGILTRLRLRDFFRVKIGAGILRDIRARAPWYWSDWKDAWNYRVLPATALVFFAKYVLSSSSSSPFSIFGA